MSAPWVAQKHHVFVASNPHVRTIIANVIPQALVLEETALHAEANADCLREEATSAATRWPTSPEELTSDWVHNEVARRVGVRDIDVQIQVLREVIFNARTGATEMIDQNADELIAALAAQLETLLTEVTARVDDLGPAVSTAAEAIEAGTADAWSAIHRALPEYRDIREAQGVLYRGFWGANWPFDRRACGDSGDVTDPEARLYLHRRIPDVAPQWRADRRADSTGQAINESTVPWPKDPTERLIWCIRNDSGIWCPTADQMQSLLAGKVPERRPAKRLKRASLGGRESEKDLLRKAPIIIHNSRHGE